MHMRRSMHTMIHAAAVALAGCSGAQPLPPAPWQADGAAYPGIFIEPIEIEGEGGGDRPFDDLSPDERQALAQYMDARFSDRLNDTFSLVSRAGPGTLRVKLRLTGATPTTPMLGTVTRFDLLGGPYNLVQALRGKEGSFTGSVSYAVEVFDGATDRRLMAYAARQYPDAWNLKATLGRLEASKAGIDKAADDLAARLR
uniref:DUF3313 domain-containing protein n=1 Tax=unclassified Variovorax TaxID=663243 RepID=UPI000D3DB00F